MVVVVVVVLEMGLFGLPLLAHAVLANRTDAEEADHVLQRFGLRRELFSSTGEFLGAGGVPLRDQANLADRSFVLVAASSLLSGRRGHFLHQVRGFLD